MIVIVLSTGVMSIWPSCRVQLLLLVKLNWGCPWKATTWPLPVLRIWPVSVMSPPLLGMS